MTKYRSGIEEWNHEMDGIDANILERGDMSPERFQSAAMSAHSKAMPDSPAVAGFAFYMAWLL
jgi:hypothetical protein